jgi:hypothetical protein
MPSGGRFGKNDRSDWEFLMETPRRSFDEISRLYEQLADQMSAKNEEEIRRVHRELLRTGELVGTIIVGRAMSSIHKAKESGRAESAINELPGTQRVSVVLQQSASEVTLPQRPPSVDVYIDRSERASVVCNELPGADGDQPAKAKRALWWEQRAIHVAQYSGPSGRATMVIFGLKNLAPEDYRDKSELEHKGKLQVAKMTAEERAAEQAELDRQAVEEIYAALSGPLIEQEPQTQADE